MRHARRTRAGPGPLRRDGFTGALTADYLAEHGPAGLRWALAGRSLDKLEKERDRLGLPELELVVADSADPTSLADLARRTKVVITTVGPYVDRGEALAGACAEAGTDYCDITGEGEFVDRVYVAHHATAVSHRRAAGALLRLRLRPARPRRDVHRRAAARRRTDHGARRRPRRRPAVGRHLRDGADRHVAGAADPGAAAARRRLEKRPAGRSSRAVGGKPHRDSVLGYWLLPLPTIDPAIVARSGAALPSYGPEFRYSHYAGTKSLPYAVGGAAAMAGLGLASQVKLARDFLMSRYPAGDGPDPARRDRSWFTVDFVGEGGGERVHTRVSGGDPGYTETAMMLAESALCLAFDDNPDVAGQVTTAQAMGANLLTRVQAGGLTFEVR